MARADLNTLRDRVTVQDVLRDAGVRINDRERRIACPIHGGSNPSAFTFDERRFVCWSCGARGDVFELVGRLHHLRDFPAKKRFIARLAGVVLGASPQQTIAAIEQRKISERRRRNLWRWRDRQLLSLSDEFRRLSKYIDLLGDELSAARGTYGEDAVWNALEIAHAAFDQVQRDLTELKEQNELIWLAAWDRYRQEATHAA